MAKTNLPNEVTLIGVRLSFPQLFVAKSIQGGEPMFGATFLMNKTEDAEQIQACRMAMTAAAKEKWGDKIPKLGSDKLALRDGATKADIDGYGDDIMFVSANSKKPPVVVDKNPTVVLNRETGAKVYAGCYVNAKVRFWAQDNQFGKRVNAQLVAVQFVADGEAFGEAPVKADEVFDNLDDGTGEAAFGEDNSGGGSGEEGGLLG